MTEDQIRYFVAIVDNGSYTETSLKLNITQSSISKQIQALECELGIQLFNRQQKHIKLTDEGKLLLPQARKVLEEANRLSLMAKKLQSGEKTKITVLTLPFMNYFGLYFSMRQFELRNPSCRIEIKEMEEQQLFHLLLCNDYDVALTYWNKQNLSDIRHPFVPLYEDQVVLAVHKDNPLAELEYITPSHLEKTPLTMMEPYTCIFNFCKTYFEENNISPKFIFGGRPETMIGCVEANYATALVSHKQAVYMSPKNVILKPIAPKISAVLGAVVNPRSKKSSKVKELVEMLVPRNNLQ
jgi:DNA-binding transcriptional LysR family regulator